MATMTQNIHPTEGIRSARVTVNGYSDFYAVSLYFRDGAPGETDVSVFCWKREEVDTIMRAMAAAVRDYFPEPEPEMDYESIAAEMDADLYTESVRGI